MQNPTNPALPASPDRGVYPTIDMCTPAQVSRELGLDERSLLDLVNDGRLPAYDIGGNIRFKVADVASMFALLAVA